MVITMFCVVCQEKTAHHNYTCLKCAEKKKRDRKANFLEGRTHHTVEDRLAYIEGMLFDLANPGPDIFKS